MFHMRLDGVLELILETKYFQEVCFASRIIRRALARQIRNCSILEDVGFVGCGGLSCVG